MAEAKGLLKPGVKTGQIVNWLKEDFGLGRGHAMAIVLTLKTANEPPRASGESISRHFTGARARWRKPYDELVSAAKSFGPGGLSRADQFISEPASQWQEVRGRAGGGRSNGPRPEAQGGESLGPVGGGGRLEPHGHASRSNHRPESDRRAGPGATQRGLRDLLRPRLPHRPSRRARHGAARSAADFRLSANCLNESVRSGIDLKMTPDMRPV